MTKYRGKFPVIYSRSLLVIYILYATTATISGFSRVRLCNHGLQRARLPCPSPTSGAYSNPCPLSQWCHPTISSSVISFSSHLQSFPESGSFPVSQSFTSGDQNIGVSASASVLPMSIWDWFSFRMDWLDPLAVQGTLKGLLQYHKSISLSALSFLYSSTLPPIHDYWKNHSFG